ncbi:MAG TPA: helix-turn-helix domain-containing protein [Roseiarcus sp.]|jgi:DNA-binding MarR family transcriptional regulator
MSTPLDREFVPADAAVDEGPPYVGALLRQCLDHVRGRMEADLKAAGFADLQPAHFAVFTFPPPPPEGLRPSDLARRIRMSRQATNHIIGQLEALGYVERRSERKGERRRIYPTPRAWAMVKVIHSTLLQIQAEWAGEIGQERFGEFMTTLRRFATRGCEAG